jgi:serine/threonine-protein kinase
VKQLGRYTLLRLLATGGMGEVWLAQHGASLVVIKRVLPHLAAQTHFLDLFVNEARVSARLNHPNLARTLEFGEVNGEYFLALEFVDGLDLASVPALSAPQAAAIVAPLADALDWAHREHGVVHGDVSSRNVLLRRDGVPKLIDFGLGQLKGMKSFMNSAGGAVAFTAPEVLEGAAPDASSDQFSLGCVLFGVLCGAPLFDGESDVEVIARVSECHVVLPAAWPEPVREVLERMLAKDPAHRFARTQDVAFTLNEYLADAGPVDLSALLARLPTVEARPLVLQSIAQGQTRQVQHSPLTPDELAVAKYVASAGPQTLEALEAALPTYAVLDVVQTLVERGVVVAVDGADGERRFVGAGTS